MVAAQESIGHHAGSVQKIDSQVNQQGQIGRRGESWSIKSSIRRGRIPYVDHGLHQVSWVFDGSGLAKQVNVRIFRLSFAEGVDYNALGAIDLHWRQLQGRIGMQSCGNVRHDGQLLLAQ